jgi:hypothetical protein
MNSIPQRRYTVLLLRVDFKYDLEEVMKGGIGTVYKALERWAKPCMHGRATISFVIVTKETSTELYHRLRPAFEKMSSVENYWCYVAPSVAVASKGADPFVHWLDAAWKKARELNESEHMRKPKVFGRFPKRGV